VATLEEIAPIAALTQCLVQDFSDTLDAGGTIPTMPPWHVQENKWRAARYGLDAIIILNAAGDEMLVTDHLRAELERLAPVAERLGCAAELASVETLLRDGGTPARQRRVAAHAVHAMTVEQMESAGLPASTRLAGHDINAPLRAVVADAVARTRMSLAGQ
jgi:carboxylate-amine ligase